MNGYMTDFRRINRDFSLKMENLLVAQNQDLASLNGNCHSGQDQRLTGRSEASEVVLWITLSTRYYRRIKEENHRPH